MEAYLEHKLSTKDGPHAYMLLTKPTATKYGVAKSNSDICLEYI